LVEQTWLSRAWSDRLPLCLRVFFFCFPRFSDPEIQQILRDPTISKVLQNMQTSPEIGQASVQT